MKPEYVTDEMLDAAQEELRLCRQDAIKLQDECVALKAELQQRALELMSLDAQNIDLATERDALRAALANKEQKS